MSTHEFRSFYANVDDPQSLDPVLEAYCVLVEVHLNYQLQATIGVFQCWRSKQAYEAGRSAFTVLQASFPPEEGGKLFFEEHAQITTNLGNALRNHAVQHDTQIRAALCDNPHADEATLGTT